MARKPDIYQGQCARSGRSGKQRSVVGQNAVLSWLAQRSRSYFNTQLQILSSPAVAPTCVKSLDLERNPDFPEGHRARTFDLAKRATDGWF